MTPSTNCAGFKKSGVFPFNPEAIDCGVSVNETHVHGQGVGAEIGEVDKESDEVDKEGNREPPVFSAEQELLFQTRYEEGNNLPDHQWLTIRSSSRICFC